MCWWIYVKLSSKFCFGEGWYSEADVVAIGGAYCCSTCVVAGFAIGHTAIEAFTFTGGSDDSSNLDYILMNNDCSQIQELN